MLPSPFFPGILLSRKPLDTPGNYRSLKRTMVDKNGESTVRKYVFRVQTPVLTCKSIGVIRVIPHMFDEVSDSCDSRALQQSAATLGFKLRLKTSLFPRKRIRKWRQDMRNFAGNPCFRWVDWRVPCKKFCRWVCIGERAWSKHFLACGVGLFCPERWRRCSQRPDLLNK